MHGVWSYVMFTLTFNFKYPSWCSLTLQASLDPNYQYDRCVCKSFHYHTRFCPKIVASEGTCMLMSFEISICTEEVGHASPEVFVKSALLHSCNPS